MRIGLLASFLPDYLRMAMRRESRLMVLALGGLAPGTAALLAWMNLAWQLQVQGLGAHAMPGWLLPDWVLALIGAPGVLVGAGLVALLICSLGMTNAYVVTIERRAPELALLAEMGLHRREVMALLLLEEVAIGLLACAVGLVVGIPTSWITWGSASRYFGLEGAWTLWPGAILLAAVACVLAALCFLGVVALSVLRLPHAELRRRSTRLFDSWRAVQTSLWGAVIAGLLTLVVAAAILPLGAAAGLALLALLLAGALCVGAWMLTELYRRLPRPAHLPFWTMAVQGLARHPNHTAGTTLAMTAGAYSVGVAALAWMESPDGALFPFWVALWVLVACATLVLTVAALAARERRWELAMLVALGARRTQLWQLLLQEYTIVALGGGMLGALVALGGWAMTPGAHNWPAAVIIVVLDLLGTLFSAWAGAFPVLWQVSRRQSGELKK